MFSVLAHDILHSSFGSLDEVTKLLRIKTIVRGHKINLKLIESISLHTAGRQEGNLNIVINSVPFVMYSACAWRRILDFRSAQCSVKTIPK